MYDSPEEVLRACVDRLGGAKAIGCRFKPEWAERPDVAARWLLDCLNPERRDQLGLDRTIALLRWAGEAGFTEGMAAWNRLCGFGPSPILPPGAEVADMTRQLQAKANDMARLLASLQARGINIEGIEA